MTKRYEKVRVDEPRFVDKVVALICDICGRSAKNPSNDYNDPWNSDPYTIFKTEIVCEEGTRYPEGVDVKQMSFDICPDCFKNKLVPFIKTFGG